MIRPVTHVRKICGFCLGCACALFVLAAARGASLLPPGFRPVPPGVHALAGGRVVVKPGEVLEQGTIVIRDGTIEAVGKDVAAPPEARVWDMKGKTIYAGFIDPYLTFKASAGGEAPPPRTPQPELTSGHTRFFGLTGDEVDPGTQGPGHSLAMVTPQVRVAEKYSPDAKGMDLLRDLGFTAASVAPEKGIFRGTSAFVLLTEENPIESILKPDVFQHVAFDTDSPKDDAYPRSLMGVLAVFRQTIFDAQHLAATSTNGHRRGSPEFQPALEALRDTVARKLPILLEPGSVLMMDRAAILSRELGLDLKLIASGQEWRRPDLAKATQAPFIVPIHFPEAPKMPEEDDWLNVSLDQLRAWDWGPENPAMLRKQGLEVALTTHGLPDKKNFRKNLKTVLARGLSEEDALAGLTTIPAKLCGVGDKLGSIEKGKIANLTVVQGDSYFKGDARVSEVWVRGRILKTTPELQEKEKRNEKPTTPSERIAHAPMEGRGPLTSGNPVLVRNATIWTSGPQGRLANADLLIVDGKIRTIGRSLTPPANATVIDAQGKHVTPGLIDCHSHSMVLGGVNEGTLPSSAMVRAEDVVNSETRRIHEQLAGGLTTANLLHGSANPIGGQNCVIKLRDGESPEGLKFQGAPSGIKFALGENVKQSNWGDRRSTRFPQTRMGVRTFIANRFTAAKQYLQALESAKKEGKPGPARDLELETLGEIIEGKRWIHCHSYRQDEILTFLRLMESFGVRVATLQHVLEGYKVAPEIAAHGAGASTFSDWWAYKFEVYDAIPYNGTLMNEKGVVVSFNSDSADLARRLNTEAAKAVKYGGASEEDALKFVTLNPAKQLKIEQRVGSLEPGKDGDFAIWSKSPLDSTSVCLETWIDGKKYFDRERAHQQFEKLDKERTTLLAKARKAAAQPGAPGATEAVKTGFFQTVLEHQFDQLERHCEEEEFRP